MKHILTLITLLLVVGVLTSCHQTKIYPDGLTTKALENFTTKNYEIALKYADEHLAIYADDAYAYWLRAKIYVKLHNYDSALNDIDNAIKYCPRKDKRMLFGIYENKADIYRRMERFEDAIPFYKKAYQTAKKVAPEVLPELLMQQAHSYYMLKDYDAADEIYRSLLQDEVARQSAMVGIARNMIERNDFQSAIDILKECEKYDDSYSDIYRFRMTAYATMGSVEKAIDDAIELFEKSQFTTTDLILPILARNTRYALTKVAEKITNNAESSAKWEVLQYRISQIDN